MTQTTCQMNVDIRSILYCLEEMKEQLRIESEKRESMEGRISALENDLKTEKERTMALEIHAHKECEEKEFMEGRITALENELSAFEIRIVAHVSSLENDLKIEKSKTPADDLATIIAPIIACMDERISSLENELKTEKKKIHVGEDEDEEVDLCALLSSALSGEDDTCASPAYNPTSEDSESSDESSESSDEPSEELAELLASCNPTSEELAELLSEDEGENNEALQMAYEAALKSEMKETERKIIEKRNQVFASWGRASHQQKNLAKKFSKKNQKKN